LAQCHFKVTGLGIMFKAQLESRPVAADLTTTIVHICSYKSLINDVKHVHSYYRVSPVVQGWLKESM